jgi:hypothetical protein
MMNNEEFKAYLDKARIGSPRDLEAALPLSDIYESKPGQKYLRTGSGKPEYDFFFKQAWDHAEFMLAKLAPGIEVLNIEDFKASIEKEVSPIFSGLMEYYGSGDIDRSAKSAIYGQTIKGAPERVGIFLAKLLESESDNQIGQRQLLNGVCANSLQHLHDENLANSEELTDLSILILKSLDQSHAWVGTGYIYILPYLRSLLEQDQEKDSSWLLSLTSLATLASAAADEQRASDRRTANRLDLLSVIYYHNVLELVVAKKLSEKKRIIEQAANNMAAGLQRFIPSEATPADVRILRKLVRELRTISISANAGKIDDKKDYKLALEELKFTLLSGDSVPDFRIFSFELVNAEDSGEVALRRALMGLSFAAYRQGERCSAEFFNSRATIARMMRDGRLADNQHHKYCLALLCAIGLAWAVSLADDVEDSLIANDGLDCAVSMFAHILECENIKQFMDGGGKYVLNLLWTAIEKENILSGNSATLGLIIKKLGFSPSPYTGDDLLSAMREASAGLARQIAGMMGSETPADEMRWNLAITARMICLIFDRIIKMPTVEYLIPVNEDLTRITQEVNSLSLEGYVSKYRGDNLLIELHNSKMIPEDLLKDVIGLGFRKFSHGIGKAFRNAFPVDDIELEG